MKQLDQSLLHRTCNSASLYSHFQQDANSLKKKNYFHCIKPHFEKSNNYERSKIHLLVEFIKKSLY